LVQNDIFKAMSDSAKRDDGAENERRT